MKDSESGFVAGKGRKNIEGDLPALKVVVAVNRTTGTGKVIVETEGIDVPSELLTEVIS